MSMLSWKIKCYVRYIIHIHLTCPDSKVRTLVCTDGATCYPGWCKKKKLLHQSCSHRKNQFVKTVRRRSGVLKVHTGTIDGIWKMLKKAIPPTVNTLKCGRFNLIGWTYVRCWQRRLEQSINGCLPESTAQILNQMAWRKNTRSVVLKPARKANFTRISAQIEEAKNREIHENPQGIPVFSAERRGITMQNSVVINEKRGKIKEFWTCDACPNAKTGDFTGVISHPAGWFTIPRCNKQ